MKTYDRCFRKYPRQKKQAISKENAHKKNVEKTSREES